MARKLTNDRLQRRKQEIERLLFTALSCNTSSSTGSSQGSKKSNSSEPVWVSGNILFQFLSCLDGMDSLFRSRPMLQNRELLCEHGSGGLHPRVARSGKLLPRKIYDAMVTLLRDEQSYFSDGTEAGKKGKKGLDTDAINDCVISPCSNLFCIECVQTYREHLAEKERSLALVLKLYDAFENKINDFDPKTFPEEQEIYAVSKNFITVFKKHADKTMKEALNPKVVCEGIDSLDLSYLPGFSSVESSNDETAETKTNQAKEEKEQSAETTEAGVAGGAEPLDPSVNGKITCK